VRKYRRKVDEDEEELAKVMVHLLRNKKILWQAEERAKRNANCLENEMEAVGELVMGENRDAADAGIALSPAV
jgi:hypothetical protein